VFLLHNPSDFIETFSYVLNIFTLRLLTLRSFSTFSLKFLRLWSFQTLRGAFQNFFLDKWLNVVYPQVEICYSPDFFSYRIPLFSCCCSYFKSLSLFLIYPQALSVKWITRRRMKKNSQEWKKSKNFLLQTSRIRFAILR